jgi:hypothetical protein
MHIKSRVITTVVVDEIEMTAEEWDSRRNGWDEHVKNDKALVWREHMAKLLNLRVTKLAPTCDAETFYTMLLRFAKEIGFGEEHVIAQVTRRVYHAET